MNTVNSKYERLYNLAVCNVQIGMSILNSFRSYPKSICVYQLSAFQALSSILEVLSGVFCEMSKYGNSDEICANMPKFRSQSRSVTSAVILKNVRAYLLFCDMILKKFTKSRAINFTEIYLRGQTLSFELEKSFSNNNQIAVKRKKGSAEK